MSVIKLVFYVQWASVPYLSIAKLRRVSKECYLLVPKTQTYWGVGRNLEDKGENLEAKVTHGDSLLVRPGQELLGFRAPASSSQAIL